MVTGGGDDVLSTYKLPYDTEFSYVYADYARKVGMHVSELRLIYRGDILNPNDTPFDKGFLGSEAIIALWQVRLVIHF